MTAPPLPPDWPADLVYAVGLGADWIWRLDLQAQQVRVARCRHAGPSAVGGSRVFAAAAAWSLVHAEDLTTVRASFDECLASGGVAEVQHRLAPRGGGVRWVHQYLRALRDEHGAARALVGTVREVTADIAAIHELEGRLAACQLRLREFGHRMQNNFAIIRTVIGLHHPAPGESNGNELLSDLISRVRSLTELSKELLSDMDQPQRNFSQQLRRIVDRARGALLLPKDELSVQIEPGLPAIAGDRLTHLVLILNELLTNATKHRSDWSKTLRVSLEARLSGDVIEIKVTDDGGGRLDADSSTPPGLGGRLVTICCDQLGATLERRCEDAGVAALLRVPVSPARGSAGG